MLNKSGKRNASTEIIDPQKFNRNTESKPGRKKAAQKAENKIFDFLLT